MTLSDLNLIKAAVASISNSSDIRLTAGRLSVAVSKQGSPYASHTELEYQVVSDWLSGIAAWSPSRAIVLHECRSRAVDTFFSSLGDVIHPNNYRTVTVTRWARIHCDVPRPIVNPVIRRAKTAGLPVDIPPELLLIPVHVRVPAIVWGPHGAPLPYLGREEPLGTRDGVAVYRAIAEDVHLPEAILRAHQDYDEFWSDLRREVELSPNGRVLVTLPPENLRHLGEPWAGDDMVVLATMEV